MANLANVSFFRFVIWMTLAAIATVIEPAYATGILDTVQTAVQTTAAGWLTKSMGYANDLFFGLAGLEFTWSAIQLTLKKNDLPDLIVGTLFKVMSLAFFAMLLNQAPVWVPKILDSFTQAGTAISGGSTPLTPSAIITQGINLAAEVVTKGTQLNDQVNSSITHVPENFFVAIIMGLTGIMIMLAFAVVALQLFVALVESYFVLGAGVIMLGFLGSRWTSNFGEKYFAYAISIGIKLFTLYLIVGFGSELFNAVQAQLQSLAAPGTGTIGVGDWLGLGGTSVVYGGMAYMVPGIASTMMNGSPSMTMSNLGAAGGAMSAAPVAAALSTGASIAKLASMGAGMGSTKSGAAGGIGGSSASGGGFAGGITGGTAALSRLTQATSNTASKAGAASSAAGSATQIAGQGAQTAAGAAGKGNPAASSGATAAIPSAAGKSTEAAGAVLKGGNAAARSTGSSAMDAGNKAAGNGFANTADGSSGAQNATGGMTMSESGANNAQRSFEADQKQNDKKDRPDEKWRDLQQAADRHKPHLVNDGNGGSGISIRLNHE